MRLEIYKLVNKIKYINIFFDEKKDYFFISWDFWAVIFKMKTQPQGHPGER